MTEAERLIGVAAELLRLAASTWPENALRLRDIANSIALAVPVTPAPVPDPPPAPAPSKHQILFGATYSNPTLPGVHNYQVQVVPAYGWGSTEANLDARILEMGVAKYRVLTACNAPPQFRGPPSDQWGGLNDRVLPSQHQAYAEWIGAIIKRNNQPTFTKPRITHVQLWNEGKGYYNGALNRWNYEELTDLQNRIYTEVKKADPLVLCGGPYPALSKDLPGTGSNKAQLGSLNGPWGDCDQRDFDWLEYYFKNGKFDFVCLDANLGCRPWNPDGSLHDPPGGALAAAQFYSVVAWWVRSKIGNEKPIWWSEIYPYGNHGEVLWTTVFDSLQSVPGEHVLLWWAEAPFPPPPIV